MNVPLRKLPVAAAAVVATLALAPGGLAAGGTTERVSVDGAGAQANGSSAFPKMSADGRFVVFESEAPDLVPGDTNGVRDVFVHDRTTGATSRVSVDTAGGQANNTSARPVVSADGRFVAFESHASNLVAGDTNFAADVFVHDRSTGATSRVSVDSAGARGDSASFRPAISADGRFVAFHSFASNLVAGDTNGADDVFVHDRVSGVTSRVTVNSGGEQANDRSAEPTISADGRFVAFSSSASNLVTGDTNNVRDIFVHDRASGATSRVSVNSAGGQASDFSSSPVISADGGFITFMSWSSLLPGGDGGIDVFVHERSSGVTSRASVNSAGAPATSSSVEPAISADGRFVAFVASAPNLVAGDTNGDDDVFVHDRESGVTSRVSVGNTGSQANDRSGQPAMSADGRFVAFVSSASNLVPGDTNSRVDVFVHDRAGDATPPAIRVPATIIAEATSAAGAVVMYTVGVTDDVDPAPSLRCTPSSGSTFALGATTVSCTANDAAGNSASASFLVHVVDTTAPTLSLPASFAVDATSPTGANVTYSASATDIADTAPEVSCSPASGSTLAIGDTTVTCTASDSSGNRSSGSFTVHVTGAAEQIRHTIAYIESLELRKGITTSLVVKLEDVLAAVAAGDRAAACSRLDTFAGQVRAIAGAQLTQDEADRLLAEAARIGAVIGC